MANAHKHKQRVVRGIPDEEAKAFDDAARTSGSDRSAVTRTLWAWYSGRPGAQLPERPTSDAD
jgi:hypothetical protein